MKYYIFILMLVFCSTNLRGQDDFDPPTPPEPGRLYSLTLQVTPAVGGEPSFKDTRQFNLGESVALNAYANYGYSFVCWTEGEEVISENQSFNYIVPDRNSVLTAHFKFDPTLPAEPDTMPTKRYHFLYLSSSPSVGGTFNVESGRMYEEGTQISVLAYPNTGYVFEGWQKEGQYISQEVSYPVTIGKEDIYITGVFRFDPVTPSNPGANYWNDKTGEVIIDDFTPGYLSTALDNVIGGYGNREKVTMVTIAGRMNQTDFGIASYLNNCILLDLSRTSGYTAIPDYAFDNTNLNSVILPAAVEHVGNWAFAGCKNLTDISCYAITPPTVGTNAFRDINEGVVIRVLSSAISFYSEADGWKDFTILPLSEEVRTLEVNLPTGSEDGRYKNMTLELVNVQNGQKQKYVISDRVTYTFNGLLKNSSYNVYVKNQLGVVLGKIEVIEDKEENVSVTFDTLLAPQTVTLKVLTPEGEDVTSSIQNTWLTTDNVYLQQGVSLNGLVAGTEIKYRIVLSQDLGMQYVLPVESSYVIEDSDNIISYTLVPIQEVTITGFVKDLANNNPLFGAAISVSQMLNGKYSKSFMAKTDTKGAFTMKVYNDISTITVSAADYISHTLEKQNFDDTTDVGEIRLKSITGATINTILTFTPSATEGETVETQNWYTDYANVTYNIFNETQNKSISEFSVQYPSIVLLEEVSEGDCLRITATSKNNAFLPVTVTTTIDALNRGEAIFPIIELGGIKATFTSTDNKTVVGILYDGKGQLIKKYNYSNAVLIINDLPDGDYSLVSMANSSLFNSILNLSQFSGSGLIEGTDYVKNSVMVKSGVIASIANDLVPVLDESKLYYTGENTLFSVNKPSIVAGNYLTLKGKIDFKNIYSSKVSEVKMIVDLPESCSFVENSVMVGSKVSSYMLDGNRLTVPMENYNEQVRFCIIPTVGGDYSPNAFVEFTLEDKEVLQPIGAANFTVKDLTITVPRTVAKTSIPVNGTAIGNSDIEIYDNGILIGQTTSLANGIWATTCELNEPYNLSTHSVYAKVKTKQGLELLSETQECLYDVNAIQVSKVIMYHDNPEMHKTYEVVFDFLNPTSEAQKYTYYIYNKVFTFTIEFTNNDPQKISDVILYVKTGDGVWTSLNSIYDEKKQLWVASGEFGNMYDGNIPVNVSVDYKAETAVYADKNQLDDYRAEVENFVDNYNMLLQKLSEAEKDETGDSLKSLAEQLGISIDVDIDDEESADFAAMLDSMTEEEFEAYSDVLDVEISTFLEDNKAYIDSIRIEMDCDKHVNIETEDGASMILSDCAEYRGYDLSEKGFITLPLTSGDSIFIYQSDSLFISIDFKEDQSVKILYSKEASDTSVDENSRQSAKSRDIYKLVHNAILAVNESVETIKGFQVDLMNRLFQSTNEIEKADKAITGQLNKAINYFNKSKNPLKKAFWSAKIVSIQTQKISNSIALGVARNCAPILRKVIPIIDYIDMANKLCNDIRTAGELYLSIPEPCPNDQAKADVLAMQCTSLFGVFAAYATGRLLLRAQADAKIATGVVAAIPSGGTSLLATLWGLVDKVVLSFALDIVYDKTRNAVIRKLSNDIKSLQCESTPPPPDGGSSGGGYDSGNPDADPSIDPSGYVYEAVSSNRLPGVTATCYYKEMVEDMYGDLHEEIVLWDAAEYAQENPLFTDEMGMYRWDVPQGLWQVKFDKEGYQTTYSEWLPVPPPQLEVNIPMVQSVQPTVKNARAYEDGIEVEFDKYMLPDALDTDNIFVTKNEEVISGTIKLMNEECAYEDNADTYASKVRFVPEVPFLTTDEITLTVSRKVKSYAGIQMESDYIQAFDIEKEVRSIVADSLIKVAYHGSKQITVSTLPFDAAIGKKLVARSSSSMITAITEEAVLDENGQATLTLTGELPGTSVIIYSIEDVDVQGMSVINVIDGESLQTATPVASRVSGTAVYRNTQVALTCETEGAVIYYTTDESCPCDENGTRQVYTDPIAITEDMTIKAVAVAEDREESEIATFTFTIKTTSLGLDLKKGWNWVSHNLETDIPVKDISENAIRIVGKTSELVNDPVSGFVGGLVSLSPMETYKIEVSENTVHTLNGYEFNAGATPVALHAGWNWIGYPVSQTMTVSEAFANAEPEALDYIFGREGFVQFVNGQWLGTLQVMKPGNGYLYHSQSEKSFIYNTSIVSKAKSLYGKGMKNTSNWAVDKYAYPNMMCMIAEIYKEDEKLDAGRYSIGAFCGTECRGISQYVDDKQMMTIFGSGDENIDFRIMDHESEKVYTVQKSEKFAEVLLGNLLEPYTLQMGDEYTGIKEMESDLKIYPVVVSDRLYVSSGTKAIDRVSLTNIYGNIVLMQTHVEGSSGLKVNDLPDGVYIVTVVQDGETFYKKIVKVSKQ